MVNFSFYNFDIEHYDEDQILDWYSYMFNEMVNKGILLYHSWYGDVKLDPYVFLQNRIEFNTICENLESNGFDSSSAVDWDALL